MQISVLLYYILAILLGGMTSGLALGVFQVYHSPLSERFLRFFAILVLYLILMPLGYYAFGRDVGEEPVLLGIHTVFFLLYAAWFPVLGDIFSEFVQKPHHGLDRTLAWFFTSLGVLLALVLLLLPFENSEKISLQRLFLNGIYVPLFLGYIVYHMVKSALKSAAITDPWKKRTLRGFIFLLILFFPAFIFDTFVNQEGSTFLNPLPSGLQITGLFFIAVSLYFSQAWISLLREAGWRYRGETREPNLTRLGSMDITSREGEVIKLIFEELSNSEISQNLKISQGTVKNHIYHIFQKTGASSRRELIRMLL